MYVLLHVFRERLRIIICGENTMWYRFWKYKGNTNTKVSEKAVFCLLEYNTSTPSITAQTSDVQHDCDRFKWNIVSALGFIIVWKWFNWRSNYQTQVSKKGMECCHSEKSTSNRNWARIAVSVVHQLICWLYFMLVVVELLQPMVNTAMSTFFKCVFSSLTQTKASEKPQFRWMCFLFCF